MPSIRVIVLSGLAAIASVALYRALQSHHPSRDNEALMFVKPHAMIGEPNVSEFIERELAAAGIVITHKGQLPGGIIEEKGIIDSHYSAISRYAFSIAPKDLPLSSSVKTAFQSKYGVSWDAAIAPQASVPALNVLEAMERFGMTGMEIAKAQDAAKGLQMKLAPGLYIVHLADKNCFIINGFYPAMRDEYVNRRSVVTYILVRWPETQLSWKKFRDQVLGATDPSAAAPASIRRKLRESNEMMNLNFLPTTSRNCVHGSASPLEALSERIIWLGEDVTSSPFGKLLINELGLSKESVLNMLRNPMVGSKPLFDVVEDMDTTDCAKALALLQQKYKL